MVEEVGGFHGAVCARCRSILVQRAHVASAPDPTLYATAELIARKEGESEREYCERQARIQAEANKHTVVLVHATFQVSNQHEARRGKAWHEIAAAGALTMPWQSPGGIKTAAGTALEHSPPGIHR